VIALGQAHGAEEEPDGDLAGKIVDELEAAAFANAVERAVGDLQRPARSGARLFLRVKAAWLSARRRSCGADRWCERRAGAAVEARPIMLPWDDENVSQSRVACTMSL